MTEFKIGNFQIPKIERMGVCANFTVRLEKVTLEALSLCRRNEDPQALFIRIEKLKRTGTPCASIDDDLFMAIGERATALFCASTGEVATYDPPFRFRKAEAASAPDPVFVAEPVADEPANDDDTGLRRVLRADVAETMQLAGLG